MGHRDKLKTKRVHIDSSTSSDQDDGEDTMETYETTMEPVTNKTGRSTNNSIDASYYDNVLPLSSKKERSRASSEKRANSKAKNEAPKRKKTTRKERHLSESSGDEEVVKKRRATKTEVKTSKEKKNSSESEAKSRRGAKVEVEVPKSANKTVNKESLQSDISESERKKRKRRDKEAEAEAQNKIEQEKMLQSKTAGSEESKRNRRHRDDEKHLHDSEAEKLKQKRKQEKKKEKERRKSENAERANKEIETVCNNDSADQSFYNPERWTELNRAPNALEFPVDNHHRVPPEMGVLNHGPNALEFPVDNHHRVPPEMGVSNHGPNAMEIPVDNHHQVQPEMGVWQSHDFGYPTGHYMQNEGMIVDPFNDYRMHAEVDLPLSTDMTVNSSDNFGMDVGHDMQFPTGMIDDPSNAYGISVENNLHFSNRTIPSKSNDHGTSVEQDLPHSTDMDVNRTDHFGMDVGHDLQFPTGMIDNPSDNFGVSGEHNLHFTDTTIASSSNNHATPAEQDLQFSTKTNVDRSDNFGFPVRHDLQISTGTNVEQSNDHVTPFEQVSAKMVVGPSFDDALPPELRLPLSAYFNPHGKPATEMHIQADRPISDHVESNCTDYSVGSHSTDDINMESVPECSSNNPGPSNTTNCPNDRDGAIGVLDCEDHGSVALKYLSPGDQNYQTMSENLHLRRNDQNVDVHDNTFKTSFNFMNTEPVNHEAQTPLMSVGFVIPEETDEERQAREAEEERIWSLKKNYRIIGFKVTIDGECRETNFINPRIVKIMPDGKAPHFPQQPVARQNDDGSLELECFVDASPAPTIKWFYDNVEVKKDGRFSQNLTQKGGDSFSAILSIKDLADADAGAYRCCIVNPHGKGNANFNLKLTGFSSPTFVEKPQISSRDDGQVMVMEFRAKSILPTTFVWSKLVNGSDEIVADSDRVTQVKRAENDNVHYCALEIKEPTKEKDAGQFVCTAKNDSGKLTATFTVKFEVPEGAPSFTRKPQILQQTSTSGEPAICFDIGYTAKSAAIVTWINPKGKKMKESSRIKFNGNEEGNHNFFARMELTNYKAKDSGTYTCNIKNESGEANVELTLNIEGPLDDGAEDSEA